MLLALAYGFTPAALPRLGWLHSRPVKGAVLVCLGIAAIFIPLSFVIAALLIGGGTRMVWDAACDLEDGKPSGVRVTLARPRTDIVRDEHREWEMADVRGNAADRQSDSRNSHAPCAREIVKIFTGVLMDHEKPEALLQSYLAARRGLEAYQEGKARTARSSL